MPAVRPFVANDIPQVASLHQRVWGAKAVGIGRYRRYFTEVFLEGSDGSHLSSLVCEETDGRIVGFIGVVPRRVAIEGRCFQAAVSSQFIVEPASHSGLVAARLAKAFLEGPQDLSIADEANDAARRIWQRLGGTTALLHSLYWTRPLRPAGFVLSCLARRRGLAPLAAAGGLMAGVADMFVTRVSRRYFHQREPHSCATDLNGTAAASAAAFCDAASLRVVYDGRTFQALLQRVADRSGSGRLLRVRVGNGSSDLGWYICALHPDRTADVVQLAATPATVREVLAHLYYQAWRHGAVAVTGRLDPRFMEALSDTYCLFHRRGPWVLIKARRPQLLSAFESGNAWFSPLDGEWSLRFRAESAG